MTSQADAIEILKEIGSTTNRKEVVDLFARLQHQCVGAKIGLAVFAAIELIASLIEDAEMPTNCVHTGYAVVIAALSELQREAVPADTPRAFLMPGNDSIN